MQNNNKLHACNSRQKFRQILRKFKVITAKQNKRAVTLQMYQVQWTVALKLSKVRNSTTSVLMSGLNSNKYHYSCYHYVLIKYVSLYRNTCRLIVQLVSLFQVSDAFYSSKIFSGYDAHLERITDIIQVLSYILRYLCNISRQPFPVQIVIDQQVENVKYNLITNDANLYVKLNPRLPWQKQHSKREDSFSRKLDFDLRTKLIKSSFGSQLCVVLELDNWESK